ncbi:RuBisCO large subunit C-terminal-like domain-containing protein [Kribbella sp. NPDC048928]|uniref:RuBisCO large subunit C-terminal-like domain-containing protein n=1 Tax=Kribbella sp. NPDC048928 TaxID=3364111 RepID=UPI003721A479
MPEPVTAVYEIETAGPLERAAEVMAGEQSSGTFLRVARETDDLRARHGATVVAVEELPASGRPPLPGMVGDPNEVRRGRVTIEFPMLNFGPSMPNLMAAVAGNLFELRDVGALRLVDLDLPIEFAERYPGPRFGVDGTRRLLDRPDGPMIGTIVKPSIGLTGEQLAQLVTELGEAGIDFIKDDELQGNPPGLPLRERVQVVMGALKAVADRTGRMPMYAFNITDDIDRLAENHDVVLAAGGSCVMVCVNLVGLAGLEYVSRRSQLPVHGHRAMYGAHARSPQLGIDFRVWQKLARLAGADHVHTNGFANKFYETDDEVLASINAVRQPLLGGYQALPVLSSAQTPGLAPLTYERTRTTDLLVLAGGGIHGHPDGSASGVLAMRQAWDATLSGESLDDRAAKVPALATALDTFGRV